MDLIEALTLTAHAVGAPFPSPAVALLFADELEAYPEAVLLAALKRCRRECRGRFALADVLDRLEAADTRPAPDEAWALIPKDESESVVWTQEMAEAWGIAGPLMASDEIAARMAFKAAYTRLVDEARAAGRPAQWTATLGSDPAQRDAALRLAVDRGRIAAEYALALAPSQEIGPAGRALLARVTLPALPGPDADLPPLPDPETARERLAAIRERVGGRPAPPIRREPRAPLSPEEVERQRQRILAAARDRGHEIAQGYQRKASAEADQDRLNRCRADFGSDQVGLGA